MTQTTPSPSKPDDAIANSEELHSLDLMLTPLESAVFELCQIIANIDWESPQHCIVQATDASNKALFVANEFNLIIREIVTDEYQIDC